MKHQSSPKQRHRGFSLVELLVVIAVIGVMSAIAIPMVSNINSNASVTSAKKQAQQIASVFNSGQAAGAFGSAASVAAAITAVGNGGTGQNGLAGSQFIVPGVSAGMDADKPAEQQVSHYLAVDGGALIAAGATAAGLTCGCPHQNCHCPVFTTQRPSSRLVRPCDTIGSHSRPDAR